MLTATPALARPAEATAAGRIAIHPRYRDWLQKCGLTAAADILALPGEVVCGHADRHVVKVELDAGTSSRAAYLKREHVVGRRAKFRNWMAGCGWVSRAERESRTLQRLEELGLPAPQWLAFGTDARGRAFLLVEELTGAVTLRELLADMALSADGRTLLAERLGRVVAECHAAGIGTPELAAKHVLVRADALQPTLIDWQSSTFGRPVGAAQAAIWLGTLHATLPAECCSARERLRMLWAYRRVSKASGTAARPRFGDFVRGIRAAAKKASARSSVRQQLGSTATDSQRLVWLDGEAVVAIPEVAEQWPRERAGKPYYDLRPGTETISLPDGTTAELTRFRSFAPLGLARAALRERPWRSRGATAARALFHLQRFGIAGPKLLLFGQRSARRFTVPSFVVASNPSITTTWDAAIAPHHPLRSRTLRDLGHFLKRLHDAGCRPLCTLAGPDALLVLTPAPAIASALAVRIVRRVTERGARRDLARMLAGMERFDKMRVLRSYLGSAASDRNIWERYATAVL